MLLDPATRKLLQTCLCTANKIEAIRIIRSRTGADIDSAMRIYDNFRQEMLIKHPEIANIPTPSPPLPIDSNSVKNLTLLNSGFPFGNKTLGSLKAVLKSISRILHGGNYEVHLEVHAIDLNDQPFQFAEIINKCHSGVNPKVGSFAKTTLSFIRMQIEDMLGYQGDEGAGVNLQNESGIHLKECLIPSMWENINSLVDIETSEIYQYLDADPDIHAPIFWGFSYLFHDLEKKRCLLFSGGSSD